MFTLLRESLARVLAAAGKGLCISLILFVSTPAWLGPTARAAVIISEIMANPETGSEWIELANVGEETIQISNYSLYDTVSSPTLLHLFAEETQLASQEVVVIGLTEAKLNNSGDTVVLYDDTTLQVATVTFGETSKGLSWNYNLATQQYEESEPTPGELLTLAPTPTPSPIPTPTPQASPTPSPDPTTDVTSDDVSKKSEPQEPDSDLDSESITRIKIKLLTDLQTVLSRYSTDYTLAANNPELVATAAATQTASLQVPIPLVKVPPKSGIISLIIGGILIATASYTLLYVLEQKKLTPH